MQTNERVTIDIDGEVAALDGTRHSLGPLAIFEVKQASLSLDAPVMRALSTSGHREQSLSKYVVAVTTLRPLEVKNRLLPDLRAAERISR